MKHSQPRTEEAIVQRMQKSAQRQRALLKGLRHPSRGPRLFPLENPLHAAESAVSSVLLYQYNRISVYSIIGTLSVYLLVRARLAAAPAAVSTAGGRLLVTLRPPRAYQVRTMHHRPPRAR